MKLECELLVQQPWKSIKIHHDMVSPVENSAIETVAPHPLRRQSIQRLVLCVQKAFGLRVISEAMARRAICRRNQVLGLIHPTRLLSTDSSHRGVLQAYKAAVNRQQPLGCH